MICRPWSGNQFGALEVRCRHINEHSLECCWMSADQQGNQDMILQMTAGASVQQADLPCAVFKRLEKTLPPAQLLTVICIVAAGLQMQRRHHRHLLPDSKNWGRALQAKVSLGRAARIYQHYVDGGSKTSWFFSDVEATDVSAWVDLLPLLKRIRNEQTSFLSLLYYSICSFDPVRTPPEFWLN